MFESLNPDKVKTEEKLGLVLKARGATLSAAESCTGGYISHLITKVSGSSAYYLGSVTSYAISVKESVLGVPAQTVEEKGVVSAEVAAAMAEGVRALTGSTYAVSTTGLTEGGDEKYPEGTVWIGITGPLGTRTFLFQCDFGRAGNIKAFASKALELLLDYLEA